MSPEQLQVVLFAILVPIAIQLLKFAAVKLGKPIPTWVVQVIAATMAAGFVYINGGFAGIALPVYAGDPIAYAGSLFALVAAAWGPVELLYRLVLSKIFEGIGLV